MCRNFRRIVDFLTESVRVFRLQLLQRATHALFSTHYSVAKSVKNVNSVRNSIEKVGQNVFLTETMGSKSWLKKLLTDFFRHKICRNFFWWTVRWSQFQSIFFWWTVITNVAHKLWPIGQNVNFDQWNSDWPLLLKNSIANYIFGRKTQIFQSQILSNLLNFP